ncbi:MAG: biosynthetic peptidoglycan transglycosylase [Merdibacter sp.]
MKTAFLPAHGLWPIRIVSALRNNMHNYAAGGSTITQQYAKNLFLTNEQTLQRKIEEFSMRSVSRCITARQITEGYLNTLYFGHSIYGISEASSYYFGKDMDELSAGELAMLVGVVNDRAFSYLHYKTPSAASRPCSSAQR